MPIYFFWGEDDLALTMAVEKLQRKFLDPEWISFNYDKISTDSTEKVISALNLAMTPVVGVGDRLVWLSDSNICQRCPDNLLTELKETLPVVPENSHLLITTSNKPDGRLKSTKLLQEYAQVKEFSFIAPWKTDELVQMVQELGKEVDLQFTPEAAEFLVTCLGNNRRLVFNEINKIQIYYNKNTTPLNTEQIAHLVNASNQNSLQLAEALKEGKLSKALELATDLINRNEPALKIVATLVGQFRTWALVKLMIEQGSYDDKTMAAKADINNPKRMFILRREIQHLSGQKLLATLPILLELEYSLKRGAEPLGTMQTKIVEIATVLGNTKARNGW